MGLMVYYGPTQVICLFVIRRACVCARVQVCACEYVCARAGEFVFVRENGLLCVRACVCACARHGARVVWCGVVFVV